MMYNLTVFFSLSLSLLCAAVCVAGFSQDKNNEILQLSIPEKLLAADKQVRVLSWSFCAHEITQLSRVSPYNISDTMCSEGLQDDQWSSDKSTCVWSQVSGAL